MCAVYSFFSYTRKEIEAWFVSLVSIEFHGVKPTTFLSTNWQKNYKKIWTAKHVFPQGYL